MFLNIIYSLISVLTKLVWKLYAATLTINSYYTAQCVHTKKEKYIYLSLLDFQANNIFCVYLRVKLTSGVYLNFNFISKGRCSLVGWSQKFWMLISTNYSKQDFSKFVIIFMI